MAGMRYKEGFESESQSEPSPSQSLIPIRPSPYEVNEVLYYTSPALDGSIVQGRITDVFQLQHNLPIVENAWHYSMELVEDGRVEGDVPGYCVLYKNKPYFDITSYNAFCSNKTDKLFPLPANAVAMEKDASLLNKYKQGQSQSASRSTSQSISSGVKRVNSVLTPSSLFCQPDGLNTAHLHSLLLCMLSTNTYEILGSNPNSNSNSSSMIEILSGEIVMLLLLNIRHCSMGLCGDPLKMHIDEILEVLECISIDSGNSSHNYSYAQWVRDGNNSTSNSTSISRSSSGSSGSGNKNDWKAFLTWVLKEFSDHIYPAVTFNRQVRFPTTGGTGYGTHQDKQDWGTASLSKQLNNYDNVNTNTSANTNTNTSGYSGTNNSNMYYRGVGDSNSMSSPYSTH